MDSGEIFDLGVDYNDGSLLGWKKRMDYPWDGRDKDRGRGKCHPLRVKKRLYDHGRVELKD